MLQQIEAVNGILPDFSICEDENSEAVDAGGVTIFSRDVEGLYPSLEIEECSKIGGKLVGKNVDKLEGVNYNHALIYMVTNVSTDELSKGGINHILPVRAHRKGTRPGMFTEELEKTFIIVKVEWRMAGPGGHRA